MGHLSDTSTEAQRVLTKAFRAMSPARKLRLIEEQFSLARSLHEAGFRSRHPDASRADVWESWGTMLLGKERGESIPRKVATNQDQESIDVLEQVVAVFESLGLAYAVGGSWASSLYGESRMTRDADLSAEPFPGREHDFAAQFGGEFYVGPRPSNRRTVTVRPSTSFTLRPRSRSTSSSYRTGASKGR